MSGLALLVIGCTQQPVAQQSPLPIASPLPTPRIIFTPTLDTLAPATLATVPVPANSPLPNPTLIQATTVGDRLPQVAAGRPDPFALVTAVPRVVPNAAVAPSNPNALPVPNVAVIPLPPLPPPTLIGSTSSGMGNLPTLQAAPPDVTQLPATVAAPIAPPVTGAQAIQVSGVVEVGGRISAIVEIPNEGSSRYVHAGDYLANGQVLVRRIVMEANQEPFVILEQDGVQITKMVGGVNSTVAGRL